MANEHVESSDEGAGLAARRLVAMNVTELRLARRLSQSELARRSGLSDRDVEDVEAGAGEMLIDTLARLANGLDVDVASFFVSRKNDVH